MVENALEQRMVRPRDKATEAVLQLLRQNPDYSMHDIRSVVGQSYPRRFATGPVFEYILDRVINEYVVPKLPKHEATSLRQKKIHFQTKEIEKARIDELTELPRRSLFTEMFTVEKQYHPKWVFLLLDIDEFKRCNTVYGFEGGDTALRAISQLLKATLNHEIETIIGRWGGEEFIVAVPGEMRGIESRIEKLRQAHEQAVAKVFIRQDEIFRGTFSIGWYDHDFSKEEIPIEQIVSRADDALYMAKTTGKNKTVRWDANTHIRPTKS